eukprot:SAG22_NODE_9133_length_608_cov_1.088409_1_plen_154_part_10
MTADEPPADTVAGQRVQVSDPASPYDGLTGTVTRPGRRSVQVQFDHDSAGSRPRIVRLSSIRCVDGGEAGGSSPPATLPEEEGPAAGKATAPAPPELSPVPFSTPPGNEQRPSSASSPSPRPDAGAQQQLTVTVPDGVGPGDLLLVMAPDGQQF